LDAKNPLTSYDMFLEIGRIKGFRDFKRQSKDRRMKALYVQGWIVKYGIRPEKAHFLSPLYNLRKRTQAAFALNRQRKKTIIETTLLRQVEKGNNTVIGIACSAVRRTQDA
jgi:hypothetical protein